MQQHTIQSTKNFLYGIMTFLCMNSFPLLMGIEHDQTGSAIHQTIQLSLGFNNTAYHHLPHNTGSLSGSSTSTALPLNQGSETTQHAAHGAHPKTVHGLTNNESIQSSTQPGHCNKQGSTQSTTTKTVTTTTTTSSISSLYDQICGSSYLSAVTSHPFITGGFVLLGAYSAVLALRYSLEQLIIRYNFWTFWHEEIPLDALTDAQKVVITCELVTKIHGDDQTGQKNLDCTSTKIYSFLPIENFIKEIDTELTRLHKLAQVHTFLRTTKLVLLMPESTFCNDDVVRGIEHVHSLKILLLDWLRNDNTQQLLS